MVSLFIYTGLVSVIIEFFLDFEFGAMTIIYG